jgi:hypothetical protein
MSSPAQTLGSWDRILLEAWLSARGSSVFVSCACIDLGTGLIARLRLILDGTNSDGLIRCGNKKRNSGTNFMYSQSDMCCTVNRCGFRLFLWQMQYRETGLFSNTNVFVLTVMYLLLPRLYSSSGIHGLSSRRLLLHCCYRFPAFSAVLCWCWFRLCMVVPSICRLNCWCFGYLHRCHLQGEAIAQRPFSIRQNIRDHPAGL